MEKLPPIEKIFEAWTAIADNRVVLSDSSATVQSSDGTKTYVVHFHGDSYSSDDNATFWRGYPGYPVIAVLMLQRKLPLNPNDIHVWKHINWTSLNKKYRNNYAAAVREIEEERDIDVAKYNEEAEKVMEVLQTLPLVIKRKI